MGQNVVVCVVFVGRTLLFLIFNKSIYMPHISIEQKKKKNISIFSTAELEESSEYVHGKLMISPSKISVYDNHKRASRVKEVT